MFKPLLSHHNRFGKHRKPADLSSPASHLGISSRVNGIEEADENEKEAARKAMREEQDRLQEKYRVHSTGRHNESYQVRSGLILIAYIWYQKKFRI